MSLRALVLMYHAVPTDDPVADSAADPHYSVSMTRFVAQLDAIVARGQRPRSVRDLQASGTSWRAPGPVALTFDDGHASNYAAYLEIAKRGGSADLFVNPSTIGTRGFLTWTQLRELAALGASIQSHGQHHDFLDDMPPAGVWAELVDSRQCIADEIGRPATFFAPPNGRMPDGFVHRAKAAGYSGVCSSRVGLWDQGEDDEIPRFAVLAGTSAAQFDRWLRREPISMNYSLARAAVLRSGKRLLGNAGYQRVRNTLLRAQSRS